LRLQYQHSIEFAPAPKVCVGDGRQGRSRSVDFSEMQPMQLVQCCILDETLKRHPSFPRRREPSVVAHETPLDSRIRGNDEIWFISRSLPATLR
jgi:hypothetical protein